MFLFDWTFVLIIPALLLSLYAQFKVKNTFAKMSKINSASGMTGAQVAKSLLQRNNIHDVTVEQVQGTLVDHYDSRSKTLRLSPGVYGSSSLAALGVAAHETGHAIQHNLSYAPLNWRQAIFPVANLGSKMGLPLFFIGFILSMRPLIDFGILFFAGAVLFYLVTLPVEFNASNRALKVLRSGSYMTEEEVEGVRAVLTAAALTYVAAAISSLLQLLRLLLIANRRR